MRRRPALAGAAIALGAGLKLWPALLIIPMLGFSRNEKRRGLGFVIAGLILAGLSLVTQGWSRTASALTYQGGRGLQIESVWASIPMLMHQMGIGGMHIDVTKWNAVEVLGNQPLINTWMTISDIAFVIAIAATIALGWLIALRGVGLKNHPRNFPALLDSRAKDGNDAVADSSYWMWTITMAMLAVVSAIMVANKTFSTQYAVWLFPPLALLVSQATTDRRRTVTYHILGISALTIGLTQLMYPPLYSGLWTESPDWGSTTLLLLRNAALVTLTAYAWYQSWRLATKIGEMQQN